MDCTACNRIIDVRLHPKEQNIQAKTKIFILRSIVFKNIDIPKNKNYHVSFCSKTSFLHMVTSTFLPTAQLWLVFDFSVFENISVLLMIWNASLSCLHWICRRCYIRYIRKVNEKKGLEGQEETRKAFDFMLGYVGMPFDLSLVGCLLMFILLSWFYFSWNFIHFLVVLGSLICR